MGGEGFVWGGKPREVNLGKVERVEVAKVCSFRLFLISFSDNLVVERILLWGEFEYRGHYMWSKMKGFIGFRI